MIYCNRVRGNSILDCIKRFNYLKVLNFSAINPLTGYQMNKNVQKILLISLTAAYLFSGQAIAQKTVGLSVKFTPQAPDSFETAILTLTDEEFSINIKDFSGLLVHTDKFNYINMDIETIEDLVQEITNKLPDVFEFEFVKDTPIFVLNPNQGTIRRSPFVPFQFFNNRIYDKAHRMPGELSFGSAFYNNDGFGDNGHFRFEYNVNYEFFQIGRRTSLYLVTGMELNSDAPDTVSENRSITIPKDFHYKLGVHWEIKFARINIGPAFYTEWSVKNFTVITDELIPTYLNVNDSFYRLQYGGRISLPISVVGAKGSFVIEYLVTSFELPIGIQLQDPITGANINTVDGSLIRGKFPILGNRISLGLEYINLPFDKGLNDSLTVNALANFSINDVAAILRRAFKI